MNNDDQPLAKSDVKTVRLHEGVGVPGKVSLAGRDHEVDAVDLLPKIPRLRLANGQLVDADALAASERSAAVVAVAPGGGALYTRPGAGQAEFKLAAGTHVTRVIHLVSAVSVRVLARWRSEDGQMHFGTFEVNALRDAC